MKTVVQILLSFLLMQSFMASAQTGKPTIIKTDSTTEKKNPAFTKDTALHIVKGDTIKTVSRHDPGKATLRSLILPGWGQAYNREYWKIPIVYGALGTVAGFFIYNNTWYNRTKTAYEIRVNNDSSSFNLIHPKLQPLSTQALADYRNSFRRDRDYSALYFLVAWGLNVADATVFGHLKEFEVSEDLTVKIRPVLLTNGNAGFSLVLGYKTPRKYLPAVF